jgi:predicted house-cleaning noncanonical NTP pyrophosphatase (MazG superfamily)
MNKDKLKLILVKICKQLRDQSKGIISVSGPKFTEVSDNKYEISIKFSMNVPDEIKHLIETQNDEEEPNYDLMELRYTFDLNKISDKEILESIDESFEQAKQRILALFMTEMANSDIIGSKQKEYIR